MVKGPWRIVVDEDTDGYTATLMLDEGQGPSFHAKDRDHVIKAVKDAWAAELGEHFADQDFVVTDAAAPSAPAVPQPATSAEQTP